MGGCVRLVTHTRPLGRDCRRDKWFPACIILLTMIIAEETIKEVRKKGTSLLHSNTRHASYTELSNRGCQVASFQAGDDLVKVSSLFPLCIFGVITILVPPLVMVIDISAWCPKKQSLPL